ncbi:MAG TPA: RsmB/NOP family class I SAM-dependent RNA methyltransferase [Solimonas sp.]|nr:RsmB/NOP family class I SAM-dependent RNA methyltransferase [Solimonas sp.]
MKSNESKLEKLRPAQFRRAVEILVTVSGADKPADQAMQAVFREHREMGSRDRALVAALLYGVLRDYFRLKKICGSESPQALCAAFVLMQQPDSQALLAAAGCEDVDALALRIAQLEPGALSESDALNVPQDLLERWRAQYGAPAARALAQALNREAPVDLRVNLLRGGREFARASLASEGIDAHDTPLSPLGLRLAQRVALQNTRAFRDGLVEPQDEGSQLLALLVGAMPGETVIDWCAGAGGKTLALAAQMQNRGRLIAFDTQPARLARMGARLARAGVSIVETLALEAVAPPAEAVLVDAPCSASGTWRRNPELRLRAIDFVELAALQSAILERASAAVRPGGRLVYATCSLFAEENERVVEGFLSAHPQFAIESASEALRAQGVEWDAEGLRLLPQVHGTDGFFAVRMRRT